MKTTKPRQPQRSFVRQKTYFFSDAHLGLGSVEEDRQKELRLIRFLNFIQQDAVQIYIVGDLFDYWFEYKSVVPKKYFRLFAKLAELTEQNIRIFFIAGNHDFWVKNYFRDELGIEVHFNPVEAEIGGNRFLIHHGDGLLKDDLGYKILKKILRSRINIFLFSLIHPDIAGWLARWSSRTSRQYTSKREYESTGMVDFAATKIKEGYDFVVMGHNHVPSCQTIDGGVYVNLGDWIFENTYAVFDGKKIKLKKWVD
ncbi:MAG: UDP-2,3-diacylglucosamine diphosphatase [Bacteroidota bacterium]